MEIRQRTRKIWQVVRYTMGSTKLGMWQENRSCGRKSAKPCKILIVSREYGEVAGKLTFNEKLVSGREIHKLAGKENTILFNCPLSDISAQPFPPHCTAI